MARARRWGAPALSVLVARMIENARRACEGIGRAALLAIDEIITWGRDDRAEGARSRSTAGVFTDRDDRLSIRLVPISEASSVLGYRGAPALDR